MALELPLRGMRVLVTRPRQQAGALAADLTAAGAEPVYFAAITIAPVEDPAPIDRSLRQIADWDWVIFSSANGVEAVWQRLSHLGLDERIFQNVRIAAIGPVTARALTARGVAVDFVPEKFVAEAIGRGLSQVAGRRFLLLSAEIAREALADILRERGAVVTHVPVYRTLAAAPDHAALAELERGVDIVTLTSASSARSFAQAVEGKDWSWLKGVLVACIGPVTAQAARDSGLAVPIVAEESTSSGLVDALTKYFYAIKEHNEHVD